VIGALSINPSLQNAMNLTSSQLTKLGVALGICFAAYKFAPHQAAKAMALGAAGVIIGKQIPYLKEALA